MKKIKRNIKKIIKHFLARINKKLFLRFIGLNYGEDIHIYGNPMHMFGSEPWCITLGNHIHITDGVRFVTHDGGTLVFRHLVPDLEITKPIRVGDYVYFGTGSMVMPGVTIGNYCVIAAGAIVTKDVPDNSVVAGVPARVIKSADEYLEKLKKESLHLGQYTYEEKDKRLRKYYHYN